MSPRLLLRLGVRSLKLHKLRSSLSILGVVFGVGAVVAMSSVGEGARRETLAQIEALGIDTVTVRPRPAAAGEPSSAGAARREPPRRCGTSCPTCGRWRRCASPSSRPRRTAARRRRSRSERRPATATRPGSRSSTGRFLSDLDVTDRKRVAVLGAAVARALFPLGSPLGESVRLGGDFFQVIGVLEGRAAPRARGATIRTRDVNRCVLVPLPALDRGGDTRAGRGRRDRVPRRHAGSRDAGGRRRAVADEARDRGTAARARRASRDPPPARAHAARLQRRDRERSPRSA